MVEAWNERPFGEDNRRRLLAEWFQQSGRVEPGNAWEHVYRLLLWLDPTTGLAHCYESDKSQPGRPWYARSLAFHDWLSDQLGRADRDLRDEIDWLFRRVTTQMEQIELTRRAVWADKGKEQRAPYDARGLTMPEPGVRSELEELVLELLTDFGAELPTPELLTRVVSTVAVATANENKRKNLVGEGFEDTLACLLANLQPPDTQWQVETRVPLTQLPGFYPPRGGEKEKKVDLALVTPAAERRSKVKRRLVTSKWSVRSDREEQFFTDYEAYERREQFGEDFSYVLVTNEFDPARLRAACEIHRGNSPLFADVVHVNPAGLTAAYAASGTRPSSAARDTIRHIDEGRLVGLADWLTAVVHESH